MSDLIDRDKLLNSMFADDPKDFFVYIADFPYVDAVEVVRCKDCRHFVRNEGVCRLLSNNYEPPVYVDDDDFCSRGERREE